MLGVIVNVLAVLLGGGVGLLFRKGIPERVSQAVMTALGICTVYIGISGSLCGENVLILIAAMVLGTITGTLLGIDRGINKLAEMTEKKLRKDNGKVTVAEGFVSATLLFCVGSMAVTGSLQAGLAGDNGVLFTKSAIDMVAAMMMAASLGVGVMLSSVCLLVYQGSIVLLAGLIAPFLSTGAVNEMTCAGSLLIVLIGTNLMGITKIKVADMLPAILYAPVIYHVIQILSV